MEHKIESYLQALTSLHVYYHWCLKIYICNFILKNRSFETLQWNVEYVLCLLQINMMYLLMSFRIALLTLEQSHDRITPVPMKQPWRIWVNWCLPKQNITKYELCTQFLQCLPLSDGQLLPQCYPYDYSIWMVQYNGDMSCVIDMALSSISHDDTSGRRPSRRALIPLTLTWNRHGIWHHSDWFMQTRCKSIAYRLSLRLFYASSLTVGAKPSLITCQGHGWCVVYDWMLWNYVWFNVCGIKWHGHNLTDTVVTSLSRAVCAWNKGLT